MDAVAGFVNFFEGSLEMVPIKNVADWKDAVGKAAEKGLFGENTDKESIDSVLKWIQTLPDNIEEAAQDFVNADMLLDVVFLE